MGFRQMLDGIVEKYALGGISQLAERVGSLTQHTAVFGVQTTQRTCVYIILIENEENNTCSFRFVLQRCFQLDDVSIVGLYSFGYRNDVTCSVDHFLLELIIVTLVLEIQIPQCRYRNVVLVQIVGVKSEQ